MLRKNANILFVHGNWRKAGAKAPLFAATTQGAFASFSRMSARPLAAWMRVEPQTVP